VGHDTHAEAKGETPKNRVESWACFALGAGAPTVVFSSTNLAIDDPATWMCTQDHRAVIAAKGLQWIEHELWRGLVRVVTRPRA
jgi:hypothetical protein